jgi:site-specific DNA recombinase
VDRQEQWGRSYATRVWLGPPMRVFSDTGIAAANGDVRPVYGSLRDAVAHGEIGHLWGVEQSRLERQEIGWFVLAAELAEAGIGEVHTDRDGIVCVGDGAAGIKAVLAAGEVRRLRRRVNDALDALAAEGRPPGGRHVGYRRVDGNLEPIPEVAEQIRLAAERVLAGWSLEAIARDFAAKGIPTAKGGRWTHDNVKRALTAPTIAGMRQHRGKVIGRGNWEPILDETTWRQLCAHLDGPKHRPARKYLLSGIAVCGRCGHGLTGRIQGGRSGKRPIYFCQTTTGGCGRLGVNAEPLEEHVVDQLFDALNRDEFWSTLAEDDHEARRAELTRELEGIEQQHVELAQRWAKGELPAAAWDAARAGLDTRKAELTSELASVPAPLTVMDPALIQAGWGAMILDERRSILDIFVANIRVMPAKPGAKVFDPARVHIEWR